MGYKVETPEALKNQLIDIYTNKELELSDRKEQMTELYNSTLGKTTQSRTLIRLVQKWKAKKALDEKLKENMTLDGHYLHNATVHVKFDKHGNAIPLQGWGKTKPNEIDQFEVIKEVIKEMDYKYLPVVKVKKKDCLNRLLEIPLFDLHFGISSFEAYIPHLREIKQVITNYKREKIIFVIGQDLLHNNDTKGNTANGTPIERVNIIKAYKDALKFYIELLVLAQEWAEEVEVIYSKGNHDEASALFLTLALEDKFPSIKFDTSLEDKKVRQFGECFIGWSHSDKGKKNKPNTTDVRGTFCEMFKQIWASTSVRELHFGHLHHEKYRGNDAYGFMVRNLATANESDDWSIENDFVGSHRRFMLFEYSSKKIKTIIYIN